jgi:hypothetical protein
MRVRCKASRCHEVSGAQAHNQIHKTPENTTKMAGAVRMKLLGKNWKEIHQNDDYMELAEARTQILTFLRAKGKPYTLTMPQNQHISRNNPR